MVMDPTTGPAGAPYGEDPWSWLKEQFVAGFGLQPGSPEYEAMAAQGVSPEEYIENEWNTYMASRRGRAQLAARLGIPVEDLERAQSFYEAQERARAMEFGRPEELAQAREQMLANRAARAGLLPELEERAAMRGMTGARWAGRSRFNELANEIAAQTAGDPRMAMQALTRGGALLGRQVAGEQAREGARQMAGWAGETAGIRGADLGRAGWEAQQVSDEMRWRAAREQAARRWAELELAAKQQRLRGEVGLDRLMAGAEGGVNWQNLATGLLGGASNLLGTYGAMGRQPSPPPTGGGGYGGGGTSALLAGQPELNIGEAAMRRRGY
jgi:hypothetical protein